MPGWCQFYLWKTEAEIAVLKQRGRFVVVYSPSPFSASGWRGVCFEVNYVVGRKGTAERVYTQVGLFYLEPDEINYFEGLWEQMKQPTAVMA